MARLAIFIDGAYLDFLVRSEFDMEVDLGKLANEVKGAVAGLTPEPVDPCGRTTTAVHPIRATHRRTRNASGTVTGDGSQTL